MKSLGSRIWIVAAIFLLVIWWNIHDSNDVKSSSLLRASACDGVGVSLSRVRMKNGALIDLSNFSAVHLIYEESHGECLLAGVRGARFSFENGKIVPLLPDDSLPSEGIAFSLDFGPFPADWNTKCTESNGFCLSPGSLPSIIHAPKNRLFNLRHYDVQMSYVEVNPASSTYQVSFFLNGWPRWNGDPSRVIACQTTGVDWKRMSRQQIEAYEFRQEGYGTALYGCEMGGWDFTFSRGRGFVVFQKMNLALASDALAALSKYVSGYVE